MNEIEDFIHRRFCAENENWLTGNCYYMAVIICHRFPFLSVYYDPIDGHFVAGTGNQFYDARGAVSVHAETIPFDTLQQLDNTWYERIVRDCIK